MNRRGFFKALAGAAALSAGGIALIEPAKTIFLPPRGGWFQPPLKMREVQQYLIYNDSMLMRYDVAWELSDGNIARWHLDFDEIPSLQVLQHPEILADQRRQAAEGFERIRRQHGYQNSRCVELPLPRSELGTHAMRFG